MLRLLQPIYYGLFHLAAILSERVLFQNRGDHTSFSMRFPALAHKFVYVGSAVRRQVVRQKDFKTRHLRVLLVARLMPDKGIEDFLEVAEILQGGPFEFVLVGPESQGFKHIWSKVQNYDAGGSIRYPGELDAAAVAKEFSQAHVFFFPSYGEGMARVMLECGFALVCPVAYDIVANRDLIAEGRGFLVKIGATGRVVDILRQLQADRCLLEEYAFQYQEHILEHYALGTYVRRMDGIVQKVARENGIDCGKYMERGITGNRGALKG
jgi:glycosyltransferase involved in cell wall biosynthesis